MKRLRTFGNVSVGKLVGAFVCDASDLLPQGRA